MASSTILLKDRLFSQPPAAASFTAFKPIRGNVGVFTGRGGSIGYLASKDSLVFVDTQFPDTALICRDQFLTKGRKIDVTLNTHHHLDHTAGNVVFKPASTLMVAQENVPKLQFEAAQRAEASGKASDSAMLDHQVYADTTFPDVWRKELSDEVVSSTFHGPAHTGGDAVVYFEKANVVHAGDLVFNKIYPVVDHPGGASLKGWVKSLDDVAKMYPADAVYIFGHGRPSVGVVGQREDLYRQREFFEALLAYTQKQIDAGKSKSEVVALDNLPGFDAWHDPLPNRLGLCLGAAYDELAPKTT